MRKLFNSKDLGLQTLCLIFKKKENVPSRQCCKLIYQLKKVPTVSKQLVAVTGQPKIASFGKVNRFFKYFVYIWKLEGFFSIGYPNFGRRLNVMTSSINLLYLDVTSDGADQESGFKATLSSTSLHSGWR